MNALTVCAIEEREYAKYLRSVCMRIEKWKEHGTKATSVRCFISNKRRFVLRVTIPMDDGRKRRRELENKIKK